MHRATELRSLQNSTINLYRDQLAESPSVKCREIIHLSFKAADEWHYVFFDEFEGALAGGFTLDVGDLSFFNDHENLLHTLKVHQVYIANEYRGAGFFRMFMECILSAADMTGAFIYLCCRPYKLNMPTIRDPMEYVKWIAGEDHYMAMHNDTHYERDKARELKEAYMKFGFLPLEVNRKDVSDEFWKGQILCSNPQKCHDDVKEALGDRVNYSYSDQRKVQLNAEDRRKHRRKEEKKKRKHNRNHKRCA